MKFKARIRFLPGSGKMVWLVFAALLAVSQAANVWALFPDYSGWSQHGFPLVYLRLNPAVEYLYFNLLFLLLDLGIWYVAAALIVRGYRQMTKYKIIG